MPAAGSSVPPPPVLLGQTRICVRGGITRWSELSVGFDGASAAAAACDAREVPQHRRAGGWKCSWCLTPEAKVLRGDARRTRLLPWFYKNSLLYPTETG